MLHRRPRHTLSLLLCCALAASILWGGVEQAGATITTPRANEKRVQVERWIREAWAGTGQAEQAVAVARCESGLSPRAKNSHSTASGVFQLISIHWKGKFDPFNPRLNIAKARRLWGAGGWRAWVCKPRIGRRGR